MVHIGYFIDDICLPPADLTGIILVMAFHFMASLSLILHLLYHPMQGALKRILSTVFFSVDWDT